MAKKKYLDFVYLEEEEYQKLINRFGKKSADEKIESLNDYLGSKGRKYKSHYYTILVWARKDGTLNKVVDKKPVFFKCRLCGELIQSTNTNHDCRRKTGEMVTRDKVQTAINKLKMKEV